MNKLNLFKKLLLLLAITSAFASQAAEIKVKVENLTVNGGVFLTPLWVGFHDGSFDSYDTGSPASAGIERIAEDGDASELSAIFSTIEGSQDGVILNPEGFAGAPVFEPGSASTMVFNLDENTQKYFSYANMVIPSNDAFVANSDPMAHPIFDDNGEFIGPYTFTVYGTQVRDAGTEENTEIDAAFLNQAAGNTGYTTSENISNHPGFNGSVNNPAASPVNILGGTVVSGDVIDADNGDFTNGIYPLMRITLSKNSYPVRVSIKNSAQADGTFLTPFWVAFHDGDFDSYNHGDHASAGLELMAEDGDSSILSEEFFSFGNGFDKVITNPEGFPGAPLFDPGFSTQEIVELDPEINKYFSYVSMLLPSNDAFIANADPKRYQLFDDSGEFTGGVSFKVYGSQVNDAGTELNNESGAPFFNMDEPSVDTSDSIRRHSGYNGSIGNPDGAPQLFLGNTNPPGFLIGETQADFSIEGYQVAEVAISRLIDGSFSGNWYNPSRSGEGFVLEVTKNSSTGESIGIVSWYTYNADESGTQSWIVGSGPIIADTILANVKITHGTGFAENFDANDVVRTPWGQISIKFTGCNNAIMTFNSIDDEYGSGEYSLQKLSTGPEDFKGACNL